MELDVYEKEKLEDVGFLTAMMLTLLGNYAQTGHYGGPLSYTPANVVLHLLGPRRGGLTYDIRHPKHPLTDKFMMAGGHCIPTCYALWIILYEALARKFEATKDEKYYVKPEVAMRAIDVLGFRRSPGAVSTLLKENGLEGHPLFTLPGRGIRALMGHAESTDVTNDVNGGPSGIGVANAAGKAVFWDFVGAPSSLKIFALEGEFAFTEGHAQELKTMALAQQVGKRLRLFFSYNNAGIDDKLIGGVIHEKYANEYDIYKQFSSYGWNVFPVENGGDYSELVSTFEKMENWPEDDRRPMVVIAKTVKGWWPAAAEGKIGSHSQIISYKSHPYAMKCNDLYFNALAGTFERKYNVNFVGLKDGCPATERDRLIQFKQNVDIALSVLDQSGLGDWIVDRLLETAGQLPSLTDLSLRIQDCGRDPFIDPRLRVENLPTSRQLLQVVHPQSKENIKFEVNLFRPAGEKMGTRRAISEVGKWINYVTDNRFLTIAADLSNSINLEAANLTGHYDPVTNPQGTRLKAGIQECVNAATMCGLASQTLSENADVHCGLWGVTGTYGAFTPLMYLPLRIFSQQNQDSPFKLGVVTVIAGHSGPETAADARSHFGIFSPQVWTLFPRGQVINLYMWDYNDVAPAYFAAVEVATKRKETGIIVIHVARPDMFVADRRKFADQDIKAAAKGAYIIRDYSPNKPKSGVVLVQGSSSTANLVSVIDRLEEADINVKIVAVISQELFDLQPESYKQAVISESERYDAMFVTTMTKRIHPLSNLGPLTEEYSLSSDFDNCWRTGGLEGDVISEARLDPNSIFNGIKRFSDTRSERIRKMSQCVSEL